jgi:ribonuclease H / adenosylcobalamin/alpha-ribazole phosphatase
MALIHLIRHGETDGNRTYYVGRKDVLLNPTGLAQARALADQLGSLPIRAILASPLTRARQTAQPLADRLGLPVSVDAALIEFDFGDLQDLPKAGFPLNLRKAHQRVPVPGGESLFDVWTRLCGLADRIIPADAQGGDLALVGHYWSNRMLWGVLSGLSFDDTLQNRSYSPETGSVTSLPILSR